MGREGAIQDKLFYTDFNLERRVRADHPHHHIARLIDFDFAYQELADNMESMAMSPSRHR